jgi:phosphoserine phosphatase
MRADRPILLAAAASARFAGRRLFSDRQPAIEAIIVDIDRTLTREDSPKLALGELCGKTASDGIFHAFSKRIIKGEVGFDELPYHVFSELYSRGFKSGDWATLMERQVKSGGIRMDLVSSLQHLSEQGLAIILATRSSIEGAKWLARRFGFFHSIGNEERMEGGEFKGFRTIIGMKDSQKDGTMVITKMTAAKALLSESGIWLDPGRTAVLSNDMLDAMEMLSSCKGILIVPKEPNSLEKLTQRLRLYDVAIKEEDIASRIFVEINGLRMDYLTEERKA